MRITDVNLTVGQISGTVDGSALALSMTDGFEYSEGKRTENITHKKVEAVMLNNKFDKVTVKVKGTKHPLTNELMDGREYSTKSRNIL